ncbi:ATPase family AAA domain-containing protein At1g05910-like [Populus alba]|uniref:ATPase family AAA domain-containing protein At1g05910-like n=1 Tax=Populus alba TaxID=43335 RepID=UPI003CC77F3D
MLSQMDPALVTYCDKIAAQGGPVQIPDDLGGSIFPSTPVVQLGTVTRTSARLRNVQPDVNLDQSYEALKRQTKNADATQAGMLIGNVLVILLFVFPSYLNDVLKHVKLQDTFYMLNFGADIDVIDQ